MLSGDLTRSAWLRFDEAPAARGDRPIEMAVFTGQIDFLGVDPSGAIR